MKTAALELDGLEDTDCAYRKFTARSNYAHPSWWPYRYRHFAMLTTQLMNFH